MRSALTIIRAPTRAYWQLGPLPVTIGNMVLISWQMAAQPDDGGMPASVASLLSDVLTGIVRVTFPSSEPGTSGEAWFGESGDLTRTVQVSHFVERVRFRFARKPSTITQISTRRPTTAVQLFDDPGYPWWLGQQVALLSGLNDPPPVVDAASLLALLDDDWAAHAAALTSNGVDAVIRAGVDGDVLGLLSLAPGIEAIFLDALKTAAEAANFKWVEQNESDLG